MLLALDDDGQATRGGDLGGGRFAELLGVDGQGLGDLAVAEDLDPVVVPALDDAPGPERRLVDHGAGLEGVDDPVEVDDREVLLERTVDEPALGDAPGQRHLAALEQRVLLEPLPGRVPLVALAGGLAVARAGAPADALPLLVLLDALIDVVQL